MVRPDDAPTLLAARLAAQVRRRGGAPALEFQGETWTYRRLWHAAGPAARRLVTDVGPLSTEAVIAVRGSRDPRTVAALLGVWRAGGAYLYLDPTLPPERSRRLVEAAGAVLTLEVTDSLFQPATGGPTPRPRLCADSLAYLVSTSGSCGRPKVVMAHHRGAATYLDFVTRRFSLGSQDTTVQLAPFGYDRSLRDLWGPLSVGARVVMAPDPDPGTLLDLLERHRVTVVPSLMPALLQTLPAADAVRRRDLSALRLLVSAGEPLPLAVAQEARRRWGVEVLNLYGPTETTCTTMHHSVEDGDGDEGFAVVGRPDPGNQVHLAADGEVLLSGVGLARGYLGRPRETALAFRPDPSADQPGGRRYHSGDLGRWDVAERLCLRGRRDRQVKIAGHRLELGEVEAALLRQPGVSEAAVVVRKGRLVGYIAPLPPSRAPSPFPEWRRALVSLLPEHAIPKEMVALPALPRTAGGKVDRRALRHHRAVAGHPRRAPDFPPVSKGGPRGDYGRERETEGVRGLKALWSEILGLPAASLAPQSDFLALGGDSLALLRLITGIAERFRVEVSPAELYGAPTLAALAARVEERRAAAPEPAASVPEKSAHTPLTPEQLRLWQAQALDPASAAYHVGMAWWLEGKVSAPRLEAAWQRLVRRHPALRSVFRPAASGDGEIRRHCDGPIAPPAVVQVPPGMSRKAVQALGSRLVVRPFALDSGPLARCFLLPRNEGDSLLVSAFHHLVIDGPSEVVIARELGSLYRGDPLPPVPRWSRSPVREPVSTNLPATPSDPTPLESLALPFDRPPTSRPLRRRGGGVVVSVPGGNLVPSRNEGGGTAFQRAAVALLALLARVTEHPRPHIRTPVTTRDGVAVQVGFFVRTATLALGPIAGDPALEALLAAVRRRMPTLLAGRREEAGDSGAAVVLVTGEVPRLEGIGTAVHPVVLPRVPEWGVRAALEFHLLGSTVHLLYDAVLFEASTAHRLAAAFGRMLAAVTTRPGMRLSQAPLLSAAETHQLCCEWSAGEPGPVRGVLAQIATWAGRSGIAVSLEDEAWSYRRLLREAAGWAAAVSRVPRGNRNAEERLVAVCGERTPTWIAAILGILAADAAFLLLDPSLPRRRLRSLLEEAGEGTILLVTPGGEAVADFLVQGIEAPVLTAAAAATGAPSLPPPHPEALAYLLYTSGSTGRPKGVEIPHRGLAHLMHHQGRRLELGPGERVLQMAVPCFDAAVAEIFVTLGSGATLVLPPPRAQVPGPELLELFQRRRITAVTLTPSVLATLPPTSLAGVRTLISAGERCSAALARRWARGTGSRMLWNAYGPTEATVCATAGMVGDRDETPTVGRPLEHVRVHVLDRRLQSLPVGAPGELCLGGEGLARGYRGRPGRTAGVFVPDPFAAAGGERLYATGDQARFLADGRLEILGRRDDQLKVRGVRVEPGEVEAALLRHPAVAQVAVTLPLDDPAPEPRLVAYLVPRAELKGSLNRTELRAFAAQYLPTAVVPTLWVEVDSLPRGATGKLDRRALPAPPAATEALLDGSNMPFTPVARRLAAVWGSVLGVEGVSPEHDFFVLGGNSLLSLKVSLEARRQGLAVAPRQILEYPVLGELAAVVREVA